MLEEKFTTIPFPEDTSIVYVLRFRRPGKSDLIPFYVGESNRGMRRIGDYVTAQFAAATDFKVGVAVRSLRAFGCDIFVSYQETSDRRVDEAELIRRYSIRGHKLLNALQGYNYRTAERSAEESRIKQFVNSIFIADIPISSVRN